MSLFLALVMCMSLCVPAFAKEADPIDSSTPPWVEEGEQWFPAGDIMIMEDFGYCPKGHTAPSGYTYQGYTTGQASGHYDHLGRALTIFSIFSRDPNVVNATALSAVFLEWLDDNKNPNLTYFKYVYTKDSSTFYYIIYSEKVTSSPSYTYITCETYYG